MMHAIPQPSKICEGIFFFLQKMQLWYLKQITTPIPPQPQPFWIIFASMWSAFQKGKKKWFLDQDVRQSQWWWILCTSGKWTCDIFPSMMTLWRHIILFAYFLTQCLRQRKNSSCPFLLVLAIVSLVGRKYQRIYLLKSGDIFWNTGRIPGDTKVCSKFQLETWHEGEKYQTYKEIINPNNTLGPKWNVGRWILSKQHWWIW